jgi:hypothetical protein
MLIKILAWGSVMGLLLAALSWHAEGSYALLLDLMVCVGAIVVLKQAVRAHEYLWASVFVGMALLLNPVVPVFAPAVNLMLLLLLVGFSPLVIAFGVMMDASVTLYPNLITDLHPRGESVRPPNEPFWTRETL